jgi:hypothetical protein
MKTGFARVIARDSAQRSVWVTESPGRHRKLPAPLTRHSNEAPARVELSARLSFRTRFRA